MWINSTLIKVRSIRNTEPEPLDLNLAVDIDWVEMNLNPKNVQKGGNKGRMVNTK